MPRRSGKDSFLLSMSLAELAFLLLFLVLLLSFFKLNAQALENEDLARLVGREKDLASDVDQLKAEVGELLSRVEECEKMSEVLKQDESLPDTWQELVESQRRLQEENRDLKEREEAERRERDNLRNQVKNLQRQGGNGLDHPPCWANSAGVAEYLYRVTVEEGSVTVSPVWPVSRAEEARDSPMIQRGAGEKITMAEFRARMALILEWSKSRDPECRHFVRIRDRAVSKKAYKERRLMIEDYFYKYEERR